MIIVIKKQQVLVSMLKNWNICILLAGLPVWLRFKESSCMSGDLDLIPRSGSSPGEGNGNPLQYSCLGKPMDRGAWQATVHGVAKGRRGLSD